MFAPPTYIISIHAPAKGATVRDTAAAASESFQSTLPRRERHKYNLEMFAERIFQSTLPRRERHKVTFCYIAHAYFNPRSREGSDLPISPFGGDLSHFNPRSREGSDCNHRIPNAPCVQFQSTLPRRERHAPQVVPFNSKVFQSTLPRRERLEPHHAFTAGFNFNPRSREGSDSKNHQDYP